MTSLLLWSGSSLLQFIKRRGGGFLQCSESYSWNISPYQACTVIKQTQSISIFYVMSLLHGIAFSGLNGSKLAFCSNVKAYSVSWIIIAIDAGYRLHLCSSHLEGTALVRHYSCVIFSSHMIRYRIFSSQQQYTSHLLVDSSGCQAARIFWLLECCLFFL